MTALTHPFVHLLHVVVVFFVMLLDVLAAHVFVVPVRRFDVNIAVVSAFVPEAAGRE